MDLNGSDRHARDPALLLSFEADVGPGLSERGHPVAQVARGEELESLQPRQTLEMGQAEVTGRNPPELDLLEVLKMSEGSRRLHLPTAARAERREVAHRRQAAEPSDVVSADA